MTQTHNAPEGSETSGADKQADQATRIVTQSPDIEQVRRRWRLRQVRRRRRISAALDRHCGVARDVAAVQIDYHATGLDLGWPERRAAGLRLLERERAA
jgi:hypothetical protein